MKMFSEQYNFTVCGSVFRSMKVQTEVFDKHFESFTLTVYVKTAYDSVLHAQCHELSKQAHSHHYHSPLDLTATNRIL